MTSSLVLRISLFGTLELSRGTDRIAEFPTHTCRSLFSYLAVNYRRRHSRSALAGVFWGDLPETVARKRLRTSLWRIRTIVEPTGVTRGTVVEADARDIGFARERESVWLDVEDFEACLRCVPAGPQPLTRSHVESLVRAVDLYQGDLLEEVYDDWCVYERERLKAMYHRALHRLVAYHASRREWQEAIVHARELLAHHPLQEQMHRELMRLYYLAGNRPASLEQFEVLRRLLSEELEVDPLEETVALYRAVRDDRRDAVVSIPAPTEPVADVAPRPTRDWVRLVLEDLDQASRELHSVRERLRRNLVEFDPHSPHP